MRLSEVVLAQELLAKMCLITLTAVGLKQLRQLLLLHQRQLLLLHQRQLLHLHQ